MEGSTDGQDNGTPLSAVLVLTDDAKEQDDAKKQPSDQGPLVRLKCATEAYTIENSTCCMNNVAHFLMTGWLTVLIAIETREDSRIYVAALIFHLFTWVVTVIMISMIVIRRRVCAGKDDAKEQDDAKKQPSDQGPLVRLKCATEAYTIENSTCCMNNVAHFLMTGWLTVLIAIETREDSRIYVAALIFHLFTWVVTVIMISMIVIRRRVCAGKEGSYLMHLTSANNKKDNG
eukprot:XP_011681218.1 PREDICTED: uncharacterized protein LOC105446295 [Strongylocentrotus purpuratus]